MGSLIEKLEGPGLDPRPWSWGGTRALVEHADAAEGLRLATALRQAGYAVAICPGPAEGARCPLAAGDGCAAAHGANVIVSSLPEDRAETAEVLPMLRVHCADTPVIAASTLAPEGVVAAVRDVLAGVTSDTATSPAVPGPSWNPFRSEREAFRLVLLTLAAFGAIVLADVLGGLWPALGVWIFVTLLAALLYLRRARRGRSLRTAPASVQATGEYRVLVALHGDPDTEALAEEVRRRAAGRRPSLHVLGLPHVSSLGRWTSDLGRPTATATSLLERALGGFRVAGLEASGTVGDDDPLQAIEDVLRSFPADELVVVGGNRPDASALDSIAAAVRSRFALPTKVVGPPA